MEEIIEKTGFSKEDVTNAYKDFEEMCLVENETEITKDLFTYYFNKKFPSKTRNTNLFVHRLFSVFDRDHNDHLNFSEFLVGMTLFQSNDHYENLKIFFKLFDLNQDNFISKNEVELVLRAFDKATGVETNLYDEMLKDLDFDKDQVINEDEFIYGIIGHPKYKSLIDLIQN